jgi:nuclear GTP-binding protein
MVGQKQLEDFREALTTTLQKPNMVLMKQNKIPWGLLVDPTKVEKGSLLTVESFDSTFGPKKTRKRPKLAHTDYEGLLNSAEKDGEGYNPEKDTNIERVVDFKDAVRDPIFEKGQSKRIWGELYM